MLTLIFIVIIIGIIGIYFFQNQKNIIYSNQNIAFSYSVKGCAETDRGMATKSINIEKEPNIEVFGNEIRYSRSINHLCCRKVEIYKEIENSVINIYEVWSGVGCRCICFSEIEAKLQNVPVGDYNINVYEKGTKPGSNELMEQKLIISKNITIKLIKFITYNKSIFIPNFK